LEAALMKNMICLLRTHLCKIIYKLGYQIKKRTKAGKYRSTCAIHIKKFIVAMEYERNKDAVRQRERERERERQK
jgi:hypothetical protein